MRIPDFLRQQATKFEQLFLEGPSFMLCEDLRSDDLGRETDERYIHIDGGRDEMHRRRCQTLIEQTVVSGGLFIPAGSKAFEVGAHELFRLARETNQCRVTRITIKGTSKTPRQARRESETSDIDDLNHVLMLWVDELLTRAMAVLADERVAQEPEAAEKPAEPFHQQLAQRIVDARVSNEWLAEKTKLNKRTVERHVSGNRMPRVDTIGVYEAALADALGVPVRFILPATIGRRRAKPRSPRKRSQKAAKGR